MSKLICSTCGKPFERSFGEAEIGQPSLATTCPDCTRVAVLGPKEAKREEARAFDAAVELALPGKPLVTRALVAINVLVFVVMVATGVSLMAPTGEQAVKWGADYGPLTLDHQWWRILTSTFVHFGLIHLGFNMWCLWSLGSLAERLMGRVTYLFVYLACGMTASVASLLWNPIRVSAGASGAIFGIVGTLVSFIFLKKAPVDLPAMKQRLRSLTLFIVYNLLYGAAHAGLDNSAHVGGLLMGLVFGLLLPRSTMAVSPDSSLASARPAEISAEREHSVRLLFLAIFALLVIATGFTAARHRHAVEIQVRQASELLEKGSTAEAVAVLQRAVAEKPGSALAQATLGYALIHAGRYEEAIAPLAKAHSLAPDEPNYEYNLTIAYLGTKHYDQALVHITNVLASTPEDPNAHFAAASAHKGKGDLPAAILQFEAAVQLQPDFPSAQDELGSTYIEVGRFADAAATYTAVLAKHSDDKEAQAGLASATEHLRPMKN